MIASVHIADIGARSALVVTRKAPGAGTIAGLRSASVGLAAPLSGKVVPSVQFGRVGLIAFWDLHDDRMVDFDPALSLGLGLQPWVNHIAFAAADMDDIERRLRGEVPEERRRAVTEIPQAPNGELRIVIKIEATEKDQIGAQFYSIDQNPAPLKADTVKLNGQGIKITISTIAARKIALVIIVPRPRPPYCAG